MFNIRSRRKKIGQGAELTEEQIKRLDELGFSWDGRHKNTWDKAYLAVCEYKKKYGDLKIPVAYVTDDGIKLGVWIRHQIDIGEKLSAEKKKKLLVLGVSFEKTDSWEVRYALAKAYYEEHGNLDIPSKYKVNGIWLSKWVNEQRQVYIGNRSNKRLTDDQISRLSAIGMVWDNSIEKRSLDTWETRYIEAKSYFDAHGNLIVPTNYVGSDGKRLGTWIIAQRRYYAEGKLKKDQIDRLSAIGMIWNPDDAWENGYRHAAAYYGEKKDLLVPISYVCTDGFTLGVWISNQRNMCRNPRKYQQLTDEQKKRLESIGMVWSALDERWKAFYDLAAEYSKEHGNLQVGQKYKTADGYGLGGWVSSQRKLYAEGKLDIDKIQKLNAIGMDWMSPPARAWETHFESCKRYYEKYGNLTVPLYYTEPDGFQLGMWLWRVRTGKVKLRTSGKRKSDCAAGVYRICFSGNNLRRNGCVASPTKNVWHRVSRRCSAMSTNKNLLILGVGQYGQVAKEIAEQSEMFETVALLDDLSDGVSYKNKITEYSFAFVAVADMTERLRLTGILEDCGYTVVTLISSKSYISKTAKVGKGVMIEAFAVVNSGAVINDCCYIGANATVNCGSEIGEGSTVCCGATVVDNTYVQPKTEIKHGQTCYGDKLAKKTPEVNYYCFQDGM